MPIILHIEDSNTIAAAVKDALKNLGEVKQILQQWDLPKLKDTDKPALVIIDLEFTKSLSGEDMLGLVKNRFGNLPTLIFSGVQDEERIGKALKRTRAVQFISKTSPNGLIELRTWATRLIAISV